MKTLVWIFFAVTAIVASVFLKSIYAYDESTVIQLRYRPRPPFVVMEGGKLKGTCGEPTIQIFEKAKVPFELIDNPPYRQLALLKTGQYYDCSTGWFRTPERERNYKYTDPICDDGPWIVLGHKGTIDPHTATANELLMNKNLRLVSRLQYTFGVKLDSEVKRYAPPIVSVEGPNVKQLFELIRSGRADYTFMSSGELEFLMEDLKYVPSDFVILKPLDVVRNNYRYIICSKRVPNNVIHRLNDVIKEMKLVKTESQ